MPSLQSSNAWRCMGKKNPKKAGARKQPCFTPLLTGKASEVAPLKQTVLRISSWKEVTMLCNLVGQPIFCRRLKSPLLLIRSKAFVRSMKEMYSGCRFSLHFSHSWRSETIISSVDLPALKPNCDSGLTWK